MKEKRITSVALKDLHKMKSLTDWKRLDAMTEEDIERAAASDPDAPMTTPEFWKNAKLVRFVTKEPVTIRIDRDILEWFREGGRGYQSRVNAVLRAFVEAQQTAKSAKRAAVKS